MKDIEKTPISESTLNMGQEMSLITFGELVEELTGTHFDKVYSDTINYGGLEDAQSNME